MHDDDTFRLVLIAFYLLVTPYGLYRRIRSHTGEKLDRWQEGVAILFGLRLTGLVLFGAGITWLIDPRWMSWSALPVPGSATTTATS